MTLQIRLLKLSCGNDQQVLFDASMRKPTKIT
jgi:hypothetical protein